MPSTSFPRVVATTLTVVAATLAALFLLHPAPVAQAGTTLTLNDPLQQDGASPDAVQAVSAIQNEAGISAWFYAGTPVNLDSVVSRYRTIEAQTANYIIGSAWVPDYVDSHDVHVYIHKDGWFLAYYLRQEPVAKMADIRGYPAQGLTTKFETVLSHFAAQAGVPYQTPKFWDFRYPNANRIMLIGETYDNGNRFTIKLPAAYTFYEHSWTAIGAPWLNDTQLEPLCDTPCYGTILPSEMPQEVTHSMGLSTLWGGQLILALIYKQP